ncbi:hypothetical protein SAM40697_5813 [Streptomyces ambofaciens]|uniref:Integral membrane protein n=1 Tax=Streptomyces ambofaciens TaxID=1889 RepID=A0ABN4PEA1_STRAM|nr:hypothetical protein [Streptomyces ambofaciens]ANB09768.1 hypothetical protein SAM40697_5813 [Streptomyces ambofaciens]
MTLWFKVRRVQAALGPALAAFALLVVVAHDQYVQLPSLLTARGNRVFLMQLVPLIVTSALAHSLAQAVTEIEAVAQRKVQRLDAALITAVAVATLAASLLTGGVTGSSEASIPGRNVLFLTGLMLVARVCNEQAATAVPVGWVLAVMFVGYRDFDRPWPWAVTLHPADYLPTFGFCLLVFAAGLITHVRFRRI